MIRNGSSAGIEPCAMSVNRWPADSTVIARRSTPAVAPRRTALTRSVSARRCCGPTPLGHELGLELLELAAAAAHELELGADVSERLLEDAPDLGRVVGLLESPAGAPPARSRPRAGPRAARAMSPSRSRRRMISRTRSTSASRVGAVLALGAVVRVGQQPDLLVVADRPRRRPGQLGHLADPQRLGRESCSRRDLRDRLAAPARSCPARCDGRAARSPRRAPRCRPGTTAPCACST